MFYPSSIFWIYFITIRRWREMRVLGWKANTQSPFLDPDGVTGTFSVARHIFMRILEHRVQEDWWKLGGRVKVRKFLTQQSQISNRASCGERNRAETEVWLQGFQQLLQFDGFVFRSLTDLWVITLKMVPDSCCIGVSEILRRFASYRRCSSAPDAQVGALPLAVYTYAHTRGWKKKKTAVKM